MVGGFEDGLVAAEGGDVAEDVDGRETRVIAHARGISVGSSMVQVVVRAYARRMS